MIYLITYNINTSVRDYTPLYDAIKQGCDSYYHPQETTWFVSCHEKQDLNEMISYFRRYLYVGDSVFVAEISRATPVQGWLTKGFWNWYEENIG